MASNINGIIYYKLDTNINGYAGDFTKNCGLKGEEIDGNFHFLRGHDIKDISFDNDNNLIITRYDGTALKAEKTEKNEYNFSFDSNSGTLTIITPNGEEILLDGFNNETIVHHDYTLEGTGLQKTPLKISSLAQTGRYLPAIKLIDTDIENLPSENVAKNDRYVTKERISRFGKLYNLSTLKDLEVRLKEIDSKWRIPTKEDWDSLLNFIDCAKPEHGTNDTDAYYGEYAGAALKSTKYWKPFNEKVLSDDEYAFSIFPVGYTDDINKAYDSFGITTAFWTSSESENGNFVKVFDYNSEGVGQKICDNSHYLSIRLVRNYDANDIYDTEIVDGTTIKCVHIPGHNLLWAKENISLYNPEFNGFKPSEWTKYENIDTDDNSYETRFFINEWNGESWDKQELKEGVGIVLYEGEYGRMHEWMVIDGKLTDVATFIKPEFGGDIEALQNLIKDMQTIINNLRDEVNSLRSELSDLQSSAITQINGIENEISVTVTDNTATVSFAPDAYFVAG